MPREFKNLFELLQGIIHVPDTDNVEKGIIDKDNILDKYPKVREFCENLTVDVIEVTAEALYSKFMKRRMMFMGIRDINGLLNIDDESDFNIVFITAYGRGKYIINEDGDIQAFQASRLYGWEGEE